MTLKYFFTALRKSSRTLANQASPTRYDLSRPARRSLGGVGTDAAGHNRAFPLFFAPWADPHVAQLGLLDARASSYHAAALAPLRAKARGEIMIPPDIPATRLLQQEAVPGLN